MKTFALFGAGRIGRIHAANIAAHAGARLKYVVDVDAAAAAAIAAAAGAAVADTATVLADAGVDALLVASPTDTHAALIEAGAAARKAILCEKPVDLDAGRARAAVAAADRAGILLAIGFNRRYDPSFRRLRQGIDDGEIGAVETVLIVSRDPSPPPVAYVQRSGGLFRDMTIHDLDMARWLLGEEPVEVYGPWQLPGRPGDRRCGRHRHGGGDAAHRGRAHRAGGEHPPRGVRLRPAHRGLRRARHAGRGQPQVDLRRARDRRRLRHAIPPCPSSSNAMPTPTGSSSTPSCVACMARPPTSSRAATACARSSSPTPATGRCAPAPPSCWSPAHEAASRRPDRQRLHRPRARDRAAGSRRPCSRTWSTPVCEILADRDPASAAKSAAAMGFAPLDRRLARTRRRSRRRRRRHLLAELPAPRDGARRDRRRQARLVRETARARRRRGEGRRRRRGPRRCRAPDRLQLLAEPADSPGAGDDCGRRDRRRDGLQRPLLRGLHGGSRRAVTAGAANAALRAPAPSRTSART